MSSLTRGDSSCGFKSRPTHINICLYVYIVNSILDQMAFISRVRDIIEKGAVLPTPIISEGVGSIGDCTPVETG